MHTFEAGQAWQLTERCRMLDLLLPVLLLLLLDCSASRSGRGLCRCAMHCCSVSVLVLFASHPSFLPALLSRYSNLPLFAALPAMFFSWNRLLTWQWRSKS